jgi:hypothetical protein
MSKQSQINIRFDEKTEESLNEICGELGISKSALVRRLTEKFILEVKRCGGVKIDTATLNDLPAADGRTAWGEKKLGESEPAPVAYPAKKKGKPKQ